MAFQMEPERTQCGAGDEGPKREPPDDNLEGTEAKVGCGGWCLSGNCVAMATKREPVCYVIFFFHRSCQREYKTGKWCLF